MAESFRYLRERETRIQFDKELIKVEQIVLLWPTALAFEVVAVVTGMWLRVAQRTIVTVFYHL